MTAASKKNPKDLAIPPVSDEKLFKMTSFPKLTLMDIMDISKAYTREEFCNFLSRSKSAEREAFFKKAGAHFPVASLKFILDNALDVGIKPTDGYWRDILRACATPQQDKDLAKILETLKSKNNDKVFLKENLKFIVDFFIALNEEPDMRQNLPKYASSVSYVNNIINKLADAGRLSNHSVQQVFLIDTWQQLSEKSSEYSPELFIEAFIKREIKESRPKKVVQFFADTDQNTSVTTLEGLQAPMLESSGNGNGHQTDHKLRSPGKVTQMEETGPIEENSSKKFDNLWREMRRDMAVAQEKRQRIVDEINQECGGNPPRL